MVLYEHMKVVGGGALGASVDAAFGLRVAELVTCGSCGKETHASRYTQVDVLHKHSVGAALHTRCAVLLLHNSPYIPALTYTLIH